ncbi:MAG: penicillin-binding protein, partial [Tabrizicola sp.]
YFQKIDRFTGQPLPDDATGDNVVSEYFREGEEAYVGLGSVVVDGGFAMGENLPLFAYGEGEGGGNENTTVKTSDGNTVVVPKKADFGTVASGGLY